MKQKNQIIFYLSLLVFFSCDEALAPVDCAGIPGGGATIDDCEQCTGGTTDKVANYLKDCAGVCNGTAVEDCNGVCEGTAVEDCNGVCEGTSFLDCSYNCTNYSKSEYYDDGDCDIGTYGVNFSCDEFNCDGNDCGAWNGSYCDGYDGISAIKWDYTGTILAVDGTDPSIPQTFYWDNYYSAIVGTYYFEYLADQYTNTYLYSGYYTTYINLGSLNTHGDLQCFELTMYSMIGPSFFEWNILDSDCYNYFAGLLGRSKKTIVKPDENSIQYNHYLSESERWNNNKHQEQLMIGESLSEDVDIINFSKISNPKQNLKISEIDSHPDVVIQEGNRYIMKYVRKEITK